ncbi:unnamed protein product [Citrullus colocynthis]|uniref:Uncharacterized protein n=1 Tax=Citrullus colocynthis TaxID=252529 RepID=A0ABP0YFZ2_9ROSI
MLGFKKSSSSSSRSLRRRHTRPYPSSIRPFDRLALSHISAKFASQIWSREHQPPDALLDLAMRPSSLPPMDWRFKGLWGAAQQQ